MTNPMSPEDHLRARIESQRQEIEQLRADISQAYYLRDKAEGRFCTALGTIEQLHAAVKTAQELAARRLMEIERLREVLTIPNITPDTTSSAFFIRTLSEHEKGQPVNAQDLINALMWRVKNQRKEIARLQEKHGSDKLCPHGMPLADNTCGPCSKGKPNAHEPSEQLNPFDSAAILAAPRERRISMSFETQEQYEAALVFLDMADEGASRDASPADLVGALQDVVHTDPGAVRAAYAIREWHFDRYRSGKRMAQGVKVHAPNYADAYEKAVTMLFTDGNKPTDELLLSERTSEQ